MRIIAGTARGAKLFTPQAGVRPTMELVKGAIFDSLHDFIPGIRMLDLFAGTGSLGIEALSRGAASVTFVELDRRNLEIVRRNLEKTRLAGEMIAADVFRYLDRLAPAGAFDLIIADPPYAKAPGERDFARELLASTSLLRTLAPGGIFVLEHLPTVPLPPHPRWECFRDKRYGATAVAFLRAASGESPA
jgi:16S rRNA (guanine966-N2)-methyltransferase